MIFSFYHRVLLTLLFISTTGYNSVFGVESFKDEINEKQTKVAMRMIGHEVLMCLGDEDSRVMPIENQGASFKIPFEFEFEFDPDEIVSITKRVMTESGLASHYIVEVEQCKTKEVVHSFEIGNSNTHLIPCKGRVLPKDCYNLLITIIDDSSTVANEVHDYANLTNAGSEHPFTTAYLLVPALLLIGFVGLMARKKKPEHYNSDLISLGQIQFDKRNMSLSMKDQTINLSNKEAELLSLLHTSANEPVQREILLQKVWGDNGDYIGRTLDVFISKLRKKLEADASVKILNIRGVGYKLVTDLQN